MKNYDVVEQAVMDKINTVFSAELGTTRGVISDIDTMFTNIFEENAPYGCFIDFGGGKQDTRKPFSTQVWIWSIIGVFLVRYQDAADEIDTRLRGAVNKLAGLFNDDHTLSGLVPLVTVVDIGEPDTVTVADAPFYWLPFVIEVYDRN
jgi:hypothetical protein